MTASDGDFFVVGGTLGPQAPSYVERDADRALHEALRRGFFCYVLTSRQLGKSSLVARVASRLRSEGTTVALLDVTALGRNLSPEQWYHGLSHSLGQRLGLEDEFEEFWATHEKVGPLLRLVSALEQVVLKNVAGQIVIFVDEIDYVQGLPFSADEFFAAIRETYNRRAEDSEFRRLTFCLLGVAMPTDLITDTRATPFNIGQRIELTDFSLDEAMRLAHGFHDDGRNAATLLERILYWTGGQPYLTQRLCQAVASDPGARLAADVDRICERRFFLPNQEIEDLNLKAVEARLLDSDPTERLSLYERVLRGHRVVHDETNALVGELLLAGVVAADRKRLKVRNRIYERVFDRRWIRNNLSDREVNRQKRAFRRGALIAAAVVAAIAIAGIAYWDGFHREHVRYYRSFAQRHGLPYGIGELTLAEVRRRNRAYKLSSEGRWRQPLKLEAISGHQRCREGDFAPYVAEGTTECINAYVDNGRGGVKEERAYDRHGKLLWTLAFDDDGRIGRFVVAGINSPLAGIEYIQFDRSADGLDEQLVFRNQEGVVARKFDGAHGERREFNDAGEVIALTTLGADLQATKNKEGWVTRRNRYEKNELVEISQFDGEGKPVAIGDRVWMQRRRHDPIGNVVEHSYLDTNGAPRNSPYYRHVSEFDQSGNEVSVAYFNADGTPALSSGYHLSRSQFDGNGNEVEQAYYGEDLSPIEVNGVHRVRRAFDDASNEIELAHFDVNDAATVASSYHRRVQAFDEADRLVGVSYFLPDGSPTELSSGWARIEVSYDDAGRETRTYFDGKGARLGHFDGDGWVELELIKRRALGWNETEGVAREWWETFEKQNKDKVTLMIALAKELEKRQATIYEFFVAYIYSNSDNIEANLNFYDRVQSERKRRASKQPEGNLPAFLAVAQDLEEKSSPTATPLPSR